MSVLTNPAPSPTFTRTQPPSIRVISSTHFLSVDHACAVQWPSTLRSGVTLQTHFSFVSRIEERKYETFSFVSSKMNYSGNYNLISVLRFVCAFHKHHALPLLHQPLAQASFIPSAISVWNNFPRESILALVTNSASLLLTVMSCCNPGT